MTASPFMSALREHMLARHYSLRTIDGYLYWIRYYVRFSGKRHPAELDQSHVMAFLGFIASARNVSVSTQKTALNALAFLYNKYLDQPLGNLGDFNKASRPRKLAPCCPG